MNRLRHDTVDGTPLTIVEPSASRGGVIVVQEAFGVNSYIDGVCGRLADDGWLAVAPHIYHRAGDPTFAYDDLASVRPTMFALDAAGILADVDAARAALAAAGHRDQGVAIIGFCMGGTVALASATERDFGAAVSFYGGGISTGRLGFPSLVELAPRLRAPWLGLYGDRDHTIAVDDVEALRSAASTATVATAVVRYAEVGHGFHCHERPDYDASSAADAWGRTLKWLSQHCSHEVGRPD